MDLPTIDSLMKPLLQALRALGGSGSIAEIYDTVAELQNLPEEILGQLHDPEKSTESEVAISTRVGTDLSEEIRTTRKLKPRGLDADSESEGYRECRSG